jgi:hypothetical protein
MYKMHALQCIDAYCLVCYSVTCGGKEQAQRTLTATLAATLKQAMHGSRNMLCLHASAQAQLESSGSGTLTVSGTPYTITSSMVTISKQPTKVGAAAESGWSSCLGHDCVHVL